MFWSLLLAQAGPGGTPQTHVDCIPFECRYLLVVYATERLPPWAQARTSQNLIYKPQNPLAHNAQTFPFFLHFCCSSHERVFRKRRTHRLGCDPYHGCLSQVWRQPDWIFWHWPKVRNLNSSAHRSQGHSYAGP